MPTSKENQITPAQWNKFKDKYIDDNPGTKSVIMKSRGTEHLITKNDPKKPIITYRHSDGTVVRDGELSENIVDS